MRLLLAIPYFAPAYAFGGSVTVAETIVDGFRGAGHEVAVVTTDVLDEHSRLPPGQVRPGVAALPNVSHRAAAALNLYAPRGLRAWLREHLPGTDAVLLHDFYSAVSVTVARAAERAGVPYVLQPLGTLSPAQERGRSAAKRLFLRAWGRRTIDAASALICSSEDERRDFLAAGADPERIWRLPLPLDLPDAPRLAPAAQPTIVSVGRLHEIKRIDRLIEAVAIARRECPQLRLDIAGPGDRQRRELEQLASSLGLGDVVRFHGFVTQEEKLRLLGTAHAFALLSRSEGLPMAALEAMACGAPAILSTGCHMPDVHDRAGIVVSGDAAETAAAIVALAADGERRARLSAGARDYADAFRRERVMPQMVDRFEALVARAPV